MNTFIFIFSLYCSFCIFNVSCQDYEEEPVRGGSAANAGRQQGVGGGQEYIDSSEDNDETTRAAAAAVTAAATVPPITSTINPIHVQGQVNNILSNVDSFNISGIVDSALGIRNNTPVRNLVNGIIASVFCNPFFVRVNPGCGQRTRSLSTVPLPIYDYVVYRVPRSLENKEWERRLGIQQSS